MQLASLDRMRAGRGVQKVGNELVLHSTRNMNRSLVVGVLVSLPVFYALLDGEFLVILVATIGGYVAYTLLS